MGGNLMLYGLIAMFIFGGIGGLKIGKLNPFKGKPAIVQKTQQTKEEYFKDKIKGIEWKSKESSKGQNSQNNAAPATIGSRIDALINSSLYLILWFFIIGLGILWLTGFNIFKRFKDLIFKLNESRKEATASRKALKQTVKGIQAAKPRMNGDFEVLLDKLRDAHDDETEGIVKKMKNE